MNFEIMKYNCILTDVPNRFYVYYFFISSGSLKVRNGVD